MSLAQAFQEQKFSDALKNVLKTTFEYLHIKRNLPKVTIHEDVCLHGDSKGAVDEVAEGKVEEQDSCGFADQGESLTVVLHSIG